MALRLDHFIYAGRDLDSLIAQFESLSGIAAGRGGRHPGLGTRNALASLGPDVYFELLAVDPEQPLDGTMGGRIDALPSPRLFAYMMKGQGLERQKEVLAHNGIGADLFDASRTTPDGRTLKWRLLVPHDNPLGDFVPKFIDWLDTPRPSTTSVNRVHVDLSRSGTRTLRSSAPCCVPWERTSPSNAPTAVFPAPNRYAEGPAESDGLNRH